MESAIVIKVKHGETLRRFNASIVDGELEFNMVRLREKILALFKFSPDTELLLTYEDEDNDTVTICDDEDLRDVVRQSLNPLRITVKTSTEKSTISSARTSGTATPLRSPRGPVSSQNLNSIAQEILNSVPEPFRKTFTKIWTDVSTGAPAGQSLSDLVQGFSEMGLQGLQQLAAAQAASPASKLSLQNAEASKVVVNESESMTGSGSASSVGKDVPLSESKLPETKKNKPRRSVNMLGKQLPGLQDLKAALESVSQQNPPRPVQIESSKAKVVDKFGGQLSCGKLVNLSALSSSPANVPTEEKKGLDVNNEQSAALKRTSVPLNYVPLNRRDPYRMWFPNPDVEAKDVFQADVESSSVSAGTMNECPFSGIPLGNKGVPVQLLSPSVEKERRTNIYSEGSGLVFHRGVRCDGCGIHPITGPRFKSKVKDDFDLCSICFSQMGDDIGYLRIDKPVAYRYTHSIRGPHPNRGLYDFHNQVHPRVHPPVFRGGAKYGRPKQLDSRFIQDVNILDGTAMAPLTPFTKIWRMRNNGSVTWPQGAQLVYIGGDKLSNVFSVAIESALGVDEELDVAVDFVAPVRAGRYVSYWRMASPSGQKFGQRVWVLIQVDDSMKELPYEGLRGFNLNLPPVSNGMHGPEMVNANPEPMVEDTLPAGSNSDLSVQAEPAVVDEAREKEESNFPINDNLLVGGARESSPVSSTPSSISYPAVDLSDLAPPAVETSATVVQTPSVEDVNEDDEEEMMPVEEILLKDLEEMGFKQVDLNKEILRLNEYDLEKSVDDLCGVSGWDPILEELNEMGFVDKATNTKLLQKNNGSIKRVVMDLLAGEE